MRTSRNMMRPSAVQLALCITLGLNGCKSSIDPVQKSKSTSTENCFVSKKLVVTKRYASFSLTFANSASDPSDVDTCTKFSYMSSYFNRVTGTEDHNLNVVILAFPGGASGASAECELALDRNAVLFNRGKNLIKYGLSVENVHKDIENYFRINECSKELRDDLKIISQYGVTRDDNDGLFFDPDRYVYYHFYRDFPKSALPLYFNRNSIYDSEFPTLLCFSTRISQEINNSDAISCFSKVL
jgi:hypothetical protein